MANSFRRLDRARNGDRVQVVDPDRGTEIAARVRVAASPLSRMRGLLGRPALEAGDGLLIRPCQGVHTIGMAYPIDVVHLDRDGVVLRVLRELPPWRIGPLVRRSRTVLELSAGGADAVREGDRLALEGATEGPDSAGPLLDRLVPGLLFALLALAKISVVPHLLALPAEPGLLAWLTRALAVGHGVLTIGFTLLLALLFLTRKAPIGARARPLAMTIALAGTLIMFVALAQPTTTHDWRLLALSDILVATGLAFSIYALGALRFCFGLAPEARGLVTDGAYRIVRHPVYLGEFIALLGALLPVLAPLTTVIFASFCVLQVWRAALEESVLSQTFADYGAYRARTPALLPWPRP